jgi:hypothetical protein
LRDPHEKGFSKTESRFPTKGTCLAIYSRCVNAETEIEQVLGASFPWCSGWAAELKELFAAYVEAKQKQNVLDYDDLMLYWAQPRALPPQAAIARLAASSTRSGSACSSDVAVGMPGHVLISFSNVNPFS